MKRFIYIIAICLASSLVHAQSLFVSQPSIQQVKLKSTSDQKKINRKIDNLKHIMKGIEIEIDAKIKEQDSLKKNASKSAEINANNKILDSLDNTTDSINALINTADTGIAASITMLNKIMPRLTVSGIGGISELQNPAQSGGNFSVQATFRLGKYKQIGNSKWADPAFLYMSFNTRTGASSDSAKLTKLFLFPNISKRDFVIGAYWQFRHLENDLCIEPIAEFSLNRYKGVIDSTDYGFGSESALLGVRFSKVQKFGDTAFEAGFVLFPYYSIINVQPKNYESYAKLLKDALPYTVHTLGLQAVLQLSKVQFFADMKYILNRHSSNLALDDFKGFTYTIGTMIAVDVLRFRLTGRDD
jgi:hypothetical protein